MTNEIWRVIPDFPHYAVSTLGNVKRVVDGKTSKAVVGKIMRTGNTNGYRTIGLRKEGKTITQYVHTLVLTTFEQSRPSPKHQAAHNNGDASDNRLENLRWALPVENTSDKYKHGTILYGENHQNAKLTVDVVRKIRELRKCGMFYRDIGRLFGLTAGYCCLVVQGKRWGHVA